MAFVFSLRTFINLSLRVYQTNVCFFFFHFLSLDLFRQKLYSHFGDLVSKTSVTDNLWPNNIYLNYGNLLSISCLSFLPCLLVFLLAIGYTKFHSLKLFPPHQQRKDKLKPFIQCQLQNVFRCKHRKKQENLKTPFLAFSFVQDPHKFLINVATNYM